MHRALAVALLLPAAALAQQTFTVPQPSPKASVTQRIGLTDFTVTWNRPAVKNRKVWGGLVPYGEVWRAGANENTTLTASTPFSLGGTQLPAGTYGLHTLPTQSSWTVILSKVSSAWGSYSYDQKEDAARATATPEDAPHTEWLAYSFDDLTDKSAVLSLRWEKLRLPIKLEVDTKAVVVDSVRRELRGMARFSAKGWSDAAGIVLRAGGDPDEALGYADRSLKMAQTFQGQMVKAAILEKKGDQSGAEGLREKALAKATEVERNQYGYNLLFGGKVDKAIEVFQRNAREHPQSWNVHDSLAEALQKKGDKAAAAASYRKALQLVEDAQQKARIEKALAEMR